MDRHAALGASIGRRRASARQAPGQPPCFAVGAVIGSPTAKQGPPSEVASHLLASPLSAVAASAAVRRPRWSIICPGFQYGTRDYEDYGDYRRYRGSRISTHVEVRGYGYRVEPCAAVDVMPARAGAGSARPTTATGPPAGGRAAPLTGPADRARVRMVLLRFGVPPCTAPVGRRLARGGSGRQGRAVPRRPGGPPTVRAARGDPAETVGTVTGPTREFSVRVCSEQGSRCSEQARTRLD